MVRVPQADALESRGKTMSFKEFQQTRNTVSKFGWVENHGLRCSILSFIGEMEQTMFKSYCEGQAFRALMNTAILPGQLGKVCDKFKHIFVENGSGTLRSDTASLHGRKVTYDRDDSLPPYALQAIQAWANSETRCQNLLYDFATVQCCRSLEYRGMTFATSRSSPRNSNVVVGSVPNNWIAAEVKYMLTIRRTSSTSTAPASSSELLSSILFVLQTFGELEGGDIPSDPYRRFQIAGGRVFYDTLNTKPLVVTSDEILCHFVRTSNVLPNIMRPHFHALPLDKVGIFDFIMCSKQH